MTAVTKGGTKLFKANKFFGRLKDDTVIWRYLDFAKLVSLFEKQALFFARVDKLYEQDPFEGMYPRSNLNWQPKNDGTIPFGIFQQIKSLYKTHPDYIRFTKEFRRFVYVNCWHINDYESAAMWKVYVPNGTGVAIRSTFKRLAESFVNCSEDVYIAKVKYIDYENYWIPENNILYPFLRKRKSFSHEQELRTVIAKVPLTANKNPDLKKEIEEQVYAPVKLDLLVEKIFVAPTAPEWFLELVKSVMKKYGLEQNVVTSSLDSGSLY